jgi:hypothetical protein
MKTKKKNFIVSYSDGTPEQMLYSYQIAFALAEMTGGHVLIIIN